jgi:hypothetical protein
MVAVEAKESNSLIGWKKKPPKKEKEELKHLD